MCLGGRRAQMVRPHGGHRRGAASSGVARRPAPAHRAARRARSTPGCCSSASSTTWARAGERLSKRCRPLKASSPKSIFRSPFSFFSQKIFAKRFFGRLLNFVRRRRRTGLHQLTMRQLCNDGRNRHIHSTHHNLRLLKRMNASGWSRWSRLWIFLSQKNVDAAGF